MGIVTDDIRDTTILRHNLPVQTTLFVGCNRELAQITKLLSNSKIWLLTILAPSGMGRLAHNRGCLGSDTGPWRRCLFCPIGLVNRFRRYSHCNCRVHCFQFPRRRFTGRQLLGFLRSELAPFRWTMNLSKLPIAHTAPDWGSLASNGVDSDCTKPRCIQRSVDVPAVGFPTAQSHIRFWE